MVSFFHIGQFCLHRLNPDLSVLPHRIKVFDAPPHLPCLLRTQAMRICSLCPTDTLSAQRWVHRAQSVPGEPAAGPVLTDPLWEQGTRGQQVTAVAVSGRNANLLWLLCLFFFFCFRFYILTTANANFQDLTFLLLQQSSKRKHSSFFYTTYEMTSRSL